MLGSRGSEGPRIRRPPPTWRGDRLDGVVATMEADAVADRVDRAERRVGGGLRAVGLGGRVWPPGPCPPIRLPQKTGSRLQRGGPAPPAPDPTPLGHPLNPP